MTEMNNDEFLGYCSSHAETPRCGFIPVQIARLLRLAGEEGMAEHWDGTPVQVVNCDRGEILTLVRAARERLKCSTG